MEKTVYQGQYIEIKERKVDEYTWEMAYFPDSLVIFPFTENNEIIMIEERRPHEDNPIRLKFVTGHIDQGETPIDCANRELQEEAGYKANKLEEILIHRSRGTINSDFYYFKASDLITSKLPNPDGEDTIVAIKKIKVEKVIEMIRSGELEWTLATLGLIKVLNLHM